MAFYKENLLEVIERNPDDHKLVRLARAVISAYEVTNSAEASFREYSKEKHQRWEAENKKEDN